MLLLFFSYTNSAKLKVKFSDLMSFSHWVVKLKYIDNYT